MILEEKIQDVSNRFSFRDSSMLGSEIGKAIKNVSVKPKTDIFDKTSPTKKIKETETEDKKTIKVNFKEETGDLRAEYGLLEEQGQSINYDNLFSYLGNNSNSEEIYGKLEEKKEEGFSLLMSNEEAEKTIEKIHTNYFLGNKEGISYEEKEKIRNLATFNSALLRLYETLSPIKSGNIDYDRLN